MASPAAFDHALNTPEGWLLVNELQMQGLSSQEIVGRLHFFDEVSAFEDGSGLVRSRVELRDAAPSEGSVSEFAAFTEPLVLDPRLLDLSEEPVEVSIRYDVPRSAGTTEDQLLIALVEGRVQTTDDARAVRQAWYEARLDEGAESFAALHLEAQLDELLSEWAIVDHDLLAGVLTLTAPGHQVPQLAAIYGVRRVEPSPNTSVDDDAGYFEPVVGPYLHGWELEDLQQTGPFYLDGVFGAAVPLALVENQGHKIRRVHPGFGFGSRVENCGQTIFGACQNNNPGANQADAHATNVAGAIVGDITLGQDPLITNANQRRRRSGVARGATLMGFRQESGASFIQNRLIANGIEILNHSSSYSGDDTACTGTTNRGAQANALYEAGVARFKSASNQGWRIGGTGCPNNPVGFSECNVGSPGAATGVFTVGAYEVDAASSDFMFSCQSTGGNGSGPGAYGTLLKLTAPSNFENLVYTVDPSYNNSPGPQPPPLPANPMFNATSSATPLVTGSAALFKEWFEANISSNLTTGRLFANMLLFGDRWSVDAVGTITTANSGLSPLTGTGRLRLRWPEVAGLDAPARWRSGSVCLSTGSSPQTFVHVTEGWPLDQLPAGVDVIRATTWFYEHVDDMADGLDPITLHLERRNGGSWSTVRSSSTPGNAQMVSMAASATCGSCGPTSGHEYRLRIQGTNVTTDEGSSSGCTNGRRVYYAFLFEDSARDDANKPALLRARPESL